MYVYRSSYELMTAIRRRHPGYGPQAAAVAAPLLADRADSNSLPAVEFRRHNEGVGVLDGVQQRRYMRQLIKSLSASCYGNGALEF
jgi:hypothetical protein